MFLISKPDERFLARFLEDRADDRLSYPEVGATRKSPPSGYNIDHYRTMIGNGADDFERARDAVRKWKMFDMDWIDFYWPDTPIEPDRDVAVLAGHLFIFSLNAARIVYVVDETGEVERYGFAYGTLTAHSEVGEERITVEHHRRSGEVWYDLYSFSTPRHILARIGYPYTRHVQRAFAADSLRAMKRAVRD